MVTYGVPFLLRVTVQKFPELEYGTVSFFPANFTSLWMRSPLRHYDIQLFKSSYDLYFYTVAVRRKKLVQEDWVKKLSWRKKMYILVRSEMIRKICKVCVMICDDMFAGWCGFVRVTVENLFMYEYPMRYESVQEEIGGFFIFSGSKLFFSTLLSVWIVKWRLDKFSFCWSKGKWYWEVSVV
jgi:hypothetical protein